MSVRTLFWVTESIIDWPDGVEDPALPDAPRDILQNEPDDWAVRARNRNRLDAENASCHLLVPRLGGPPRSEGRKACRKEAVGLREDCVIRLSQDMGHVRSGTFKVGPVGLADTLRKEPSWRMKRLRRASKKLPSPWSVGTFCRRIPVFSSRLLLPDCRFPTMKRS